MAIWYENMSSIISYLKKPIKLQLDTIRYPVELLKFKTIGEGLQGTQGDFEEWCIGSLSWLWWWFNDCIYIYVCVYKYICQTLSRMYTLNMCNVLYSNHIL